MGEVGEKNGMEMVSFNRLGTIPAPFEFPAVVVLLRRWKVICRALGGCWMAPKTTECDKRCAFQDETRKPASCSPSTTHSVGWPNSAGKWVSTHREK
jgi:hypothetical protein